MNSLEKGKFWWKFLFPIEMFPAQWVSPIKPRLGHRGQKFKWDKITTVGFVARLLCQMSKLAAISELWPPLLPLSTPSTFAPAPCISNCFKKPMQWSAEIVNLNFVQHRSLDVWWTALFLLSQDQRKPTKTWPFCFFSLHEFRWRKCDVNKTHTFN